MPMPVPRYDATQRTTRAPARAKAQKRWKPLLPPNALEASYVEALVGLLDKAWARLTAALQPVLKEADEDEVDVRGDALHLDAKKKRKASVTFEVVVEDLPETVAEPLSEKAVAPVAEKAAKATDTTHLRALRKSFSEAVGITVLKSEPTLEKPVRDFTKRNVELIKSMQGDVLERLKRELGAALDSGARAPELSKLLQEQYGVAKRKADFIARDQVGKLYASLTEERHRKLGITRYKWRTVRDNRVRRRHVKREGVVFEYAKPPHEDPTDGHAGSPPRCRCYQEPVIDDVLPPEEGLKREKETVDPAPPEAPRPPRSVVQVETVEQAQQRVKRAAVAAEKKAAAAKKPKPKPPPMPVDRRKGWKAERVYTVPIEELADVPALAWNGREETAKKIWEAGLWDKMDPIRVFTDDKQTKARELADGNHRLAFARANGITHIRVRFSDREAAGLIARPMNPGAPWFIRQNPQDYPHLVNPDGTPLKK